MSVRSLLLFLLLFPAVVADETPLQWTYVPVAVFAGDPFTVSLRAPGTPELQGVADATRLQEGASGAWNLTIDPQQDQQQIRISSAGQDISLNLLMEEQTLAAAPLRTHPSVLGHTAVSVFVAQRAGQAGDRRYGWLRRIQQPTLVDWQIQWPEVTTWGHSPLLASMREWSHAVEDNRILVLCHRELQVGWSPEAYAALLAWMIAAHQAQGHQVALLAPPLHPAEVEQAQPLLRSIRQVVEDYAIPLISLDALQAVDFWELAPGVSGTWLNAEGQDVLQNILAGHVGTSPRIPENGFSNEGEAP